MGRQNRGFGRGAVFKQRADQMEEQYSCDEDEWEGQEGSLLSSRCSPARGGARWSQPGGQVSDHSDTLADQSEEVESRMSEMSTGSRNSKMSSGRKSMSRINYKAEHGSYLHLSGDEDETEDTKEERNDGAWSWCNSFVFMIGSFSLLLLCLLVVFILVPSQHSVDLRRCLLQDIQGLPQEPETMNSI